jgi:hypothetical protein
MKPLASVTASLSAAACVASHVLVGSARPPILPEQVQLYLEPPAREYQEIAIVDASSRYSFALSGEGKAEVVIRRLKAEAAKLGANGILLQEIADEPLASVDTAVGTEFSSARGNVDLGLSGTGLLLQKFGRGIAVHLESGRSPGR